MKVKPDGTFDFDDKGLLSTQVITNAAVRLLFDIYEKRKSFEEAMKIRDLRTSCGADNPPIRVRMWSESDG